jgi:hypothetical protein
MDPVEILSNVIINDTFLVLNAKVTKNFFHIVEQKGYEQ